MSDKIVYRDIRYKAEREILRLKEALDYGEKDDPARRQDIFDHTINAAITIYHLLEWILPEEEEDRKALVASHEEFQKLHDVATYFKHSKVSRPQSNKDHETKFRPDEPIYSINQSTINISIPITPEFGNEPLIPVFERALILIDEIKESRKTSYISSSHNSP